MFCSTLQFNKCYKLLVKEEEEVVTYEEFLEVWRAWYSDDAVFEGEAKAFHYVWALGVYISELWVERLQHISVAECAIHFGGKRLPGSEMLKCVDYMRGQDVWSAYAGFTNVFPNVPLIQSTKWFMETSCQKMVKGR